MSASTARKWALAYYVGEFAWFLLWFGAMIALESLVNGATEEQYEINNTLLALHGFGLGALVYYAEGGRLWCMIIPILMVSSTDLNAIIHVVLHIPRTITWAWNLVLFIPCFGLLLDAFALIWVIYYVYVARVSFEQKRSAGAAASTARRISYAK